MNQVDLAELFDTEEKCIAYLEALRWPKGVRCMKCGNDRISRFQASGKTGKVRHLYQCLSCRYQFSVRSGTIFHDSHLPLQKWFTAMALVGQSQGTISANQLRRVLGVQYKTAWQLAHRLRQAMQQSVQETLRHPPGTGQSELHLDRESAPGIQRESWERQVLMRFLERSPRGETGPIPIPRETIGVEASSRRGVNANGAEAGLGSPSPALRRTHRPESIRPISPPSARVEAHEPIENLWSFWQRSVFGSFPVVSARHFPGYVNEVTYLFGSQIMAALPAGILCPLGKGLKRTLEARPMGSGPIK